LILDFAPKDIILASSAIKGKVIGIYPEVEPGLATLRALMQFTAQPIICW